MKVQSERARSIIAEANLTHPPLELHQWKKMSECNCRSKSSVSNQMKVASERALSIIAEANGVCGPSGVAPELILSGVRMYIHKK